MIKHEITVKLFSVQSRVDLFHKNDSWVIFSFCYDTCTVGFSSLILYGISSGGAVRSDPHTIFH